MRQYQDVAANSYLLRLLVSEDSPLSTVDSTTEIRIVRLNTDKTRRTAGSETMYQVYFELSDTPTSTWRDFFAQEWLKANPAQEAVIDGRFLAVRSPLQEIAPVKLPALKKAVAEVNEAYRRHLLEMVREQEHRNDVRKLERADVDRVADSLRFD
jgi:hypothetical protein